MCLPKEVTQKCIVFSAKNPLGRGEKLYFAASLTISPMGSYRMGRKATW